MNRIKKILSILLILILAYSIAYCESDTSGRESLFLLGVGGRALGMGGAFCAVPSDAAQVYYNPAGIADLEYRELTLLGTQLYENTNYLFGSFAYPVLGLGTFAFSGIRIGTDDVVFRDALGALGNFNYSEGQYWLSYGIRIHRRIAFGANLKFINQNLGDISTSTGAFDIGLQVNYKNSIYLGLTAQEVYSGEMKLGLHGENMPYNLKVGMAFINDWEKIGLLLAIDADRTEDLKLKFHLGGELSLSRIFFLRAGYDRSEATFGAGLRYKLLQFDYAYKNHSTLDGTHRFGISFFFGPTISRQKSARVERQVQAELARMNSNRRDAIFRLTNKADRFYQEQVWDSAAAIYNQVLAYDPNNKHAVTRINDIAGRLKDRTEIEIDTKAGQQAYQRLMQNYVLVADSLFENQKYESAQLEYQKILELDSVNQYAIDRLQAIDNHFIMLFAQLVSEGDVLTSRESYAEAVVKYSEAQKIQPGNPFVISKINFAKTKLLAAQKLKEAVEILSAGDTAVARQLFIEILQADPETQVAQNYLNSLEPKTEILPVSIDELRADQEYWDMYLAGLRFFGEGQYLQAIENWETVLEKYPGSQDTQENLSQARLRLNKD